MIDIMIDQKDEILIKTDIVLLLKSELFHDYDYSIL